jgi:hypothetical protein
MNVLEIVACGLTCLGIFLVYPRVRCKRSFQCCWLAVQPYCAILLINASFPYTYKYDRIVWIAPLVLGMVSLLAGSIYFSFNKLVESDLKAAPENRLLQAKPILYVLAYCSVLMLFAEFVINPTFSFSMDLTANRDVLSKASPIGTAARFFAGSTLLLLQIAVGNMAKLKQSTTPTSGRLTSLSNGSTVAQIVPFLLCTLFFLASGNRQLLFIGLLIVLFTSVYNYGLLPMINRKSLLTTLAFATGSVLFQFFRQGLVEGRQDEFLKVVIGIVENEGNIFGSNYTANSTALLVFTYYGLQYNCLSAVLASDLHVNLPFVNTLPVIYRRIYTMFGLEDPINIALQSQDILGGELNGFGGVWVTMFGTFYSEFAWFSFLGYPAIIVATIFLLSKSLQACKSVEIRFCAMLTCLTFGVHYVITKEVPGFGYVVFVLIPWGQLFDDSRR